MVPIHQGGSLHLPYLTGVQWVSMWYGSYPPTAHKRYANFHSTFPDDQRIGWFRVVYPDLIIDCPCAILLVGRLQYPKVASGFCCVAVGWIEEERVQRLEKEFPWCACLCLQICACSVVFSLRRQRVILMVLQLDLLLDLHWIGLLVSVFFLGGSSILSVGLAFSACLVGLKHRGLIGRLRLSLPHSVLWSLRVFHFLQCFLISIMTKSLVCCFDVLSTFATFTVRVLHAVSILFIPGTRARVRMSPNVDIVDYLRVCWTFCHAFPSTAASTVLFVYSLSFFVILYRFARVFLGLKA